MSVGKPQLPEQAEITNVGFTWQPERFDGLELSIDYGDSIVYEPFQFLDMLRATGQSAASYDSTPGSASRRAADAWLAGQPNIFRNPVTGAVELVLIQSANVAEFDVKLDFKNYQFDILAPRLAAI